MEQPLDSVKGSYTMTDVQNSVDSDFLEAGRGTFQEGVGGWNMAAVSKVRFNDLFFLIYFERFRN